MKPAVKLLIFSITVFVNQFARAQDDTKLNTLVDLYKTQTNNASKLATLNELFLITRATDANKSLSYLLEQQSLAKRLGDQEAFADVNYNFGLYFEGKGNNDSANMHFLFKQVGAHISIE
jgi:hypothetical protein